MGAGVEVDAYDVDGVGVGVRAGMCDDARGGRYHGVLWILVPLILGTEGLVEGAEQGGKYITLLQHRSRDVKHRTLSYGIIAHADGMVAVKHPLRPALRRRGFGSDAHMVAAGGGVVGDGEDLAGVAADEDVVFSSEVADEDGLDDGGFSFLSELAGGEAGAVAGQGWGEGWWWGEVWSPLDGL